MSHAPQLPLPGIEDLPGDIVLEEWAAGPLRCVRIRRPATDFYPEITIVRAWDGDTLVVTMNMRADVDVTREELDRPIATLARGRIKRLNTEDGSG